MILGRNLTLNLNPTNIPYSNSKQDKIIEICKTIKHRLKYYNPMSKSDFEDNRDHITKRETGLKDCYSINSKEIVEILINLGDSNNKISFFGLMPTITRSQVYLCVSIYTCIKVKLPKNIQQLNAFIREFFSKLLPDEFSITDSWSESYFNEITNLKMYDSPNEIGGKYNLKLIRSFWPGSKKEIFKNHVKMDKKDNIFINKIIKYLELSVDLKQYKERRLNLCLAIEKVVYNTTFPYGINEDLELKVDQIINELDLKSFNKGYIEIRWHSRHVFKKKPQTYIQNRNFGNLSNKDLELSIQKIKQYFILTVSKFSENEFDKFKLKIKQLIKKEHHQHIEIEELLNSDTPKVKLKIFIADLTNDFQMFLGWKNLRKILQHLFNWVDNIEFNMVPDLINEGIDNIMLVPIAILKEENLNYNPIMDSFIPEIRNSILSYLDTCDINEVKLANKESYNIALLVQWSEAIRTKNFKVISALRNIWPDNLSDEVKNGVWEYAWNFEAINKNKMNVNKINVQIINHLLSIRYIPQDLAADMNIVLFIAKLDYCHLDKFYFFKIADRLLRLGARLPAPEKCINNFDKTSEYLVFLYKNPIDLYIATRNNSDLINKQDETGKTIMHYLASAHDNNLVPLMTAFKVISSMVDKFDLNLNIKEIITGNTALHTAAESFYSDDRISSNIIFAEFINLASKTSCNFELLNKKGLGMLHILAIVQDIFPLCGVENPIDILFENLTKPINIKVLSKDGFTPIYYAKLNSNNSSVKTLKKEVFN